MFAKKYQKLEFSALEDEILIEKVKENPPVYAKKLKSYKEMKLKDNIWAKISKQLGELGHNRTGEDCKKRWSNLRDYYMRKKKASTTGSAASSQGNERFHRLSFLDNTAFVHRTTKSNVSTPVRTDGQTGDSNKNVGDVSDNETQHDGTEYEDLIEETPNKEREDMDITQEFASKQVSEMVTVEQIGGTKRLAQSETPRKSNVKKVRKQILQDIDKGRSERISLLRELAQRNASVPQTIEDPTDIFFKSLAATAKTLSPRYLVEAKRKLFLVMADIEEKYIEEKYSSSRQPPNPSPLPTPSPSYSILSHSDDSSSSGRVIGQREYGPSYNTTPGHREYDHQHSGPSYNTTPSPGETEHENPCTLQSYLVTYP